MLTSGSRGLTSWSPSDLIKIEERLSAGGRPAMAGGRASKYTAGYRERIWKIMGGLGRGQLAPQTSQYHSLGSEGGRRNSAALQKGTPFKPGGKYWRP